VKTIPWLTSLAAALALSLAAPAPAAPKAEKPSLAPPGAAAKKGPRGGRALARLQAAMDQLGLTAAQKPKVTALVKATQAEVKKIREGAGTPEQKRPKVQAAMKDARMKLLAMLTPAQQKKLKALLEQSRQQLAQRNGGAGKTKKVAPVN